MLLYRVFPWLPDAKAGEPGHPSYLHRPQGHGRFDNPTEYDAWYLAAEASGAVGETFGDLPEWTPVMFSFPFLPGAERALGIYEVSDDLPVLNLDDAATLLDRGLRPSQVVSRNRADTQGWALKIAEEIDASGRQKWQGVRWWSYHRPHWTLYCLWGQIPRCVEVQTLSVEHPAVVDASKSLGRRIRP